MKRLDKAAIKDLQHILDGIVDQMAAYPPPDFDPFDNTIGTFPLPDGYTPTGLGIYNHEIRFKRDGIKIHVKVMDYDGETVLYKKTYNPTWHRLPVKINNN